MSEATPYRYDAVLLAGFGGPNRPEDVMPFLRNVTRGRGVPDERLADVAEHYLALGGSSPINAQNEALRDALTVELGRRHLEVPVRWGNRNWSPYVAEALADAHAAGARRVLGLATSAYSSYSSCRQYREDFASGLIDAGLVGRLTVDKVRPYYDLPGFVEPFVDGIDRAMDSAAAVGHDAARTPIVFTTHSIPLSMADASGTEGDGRLYVEQHRAACTEVMRRLTVRCPVDAKPDADRTAGYPSWQLVYQSRSGPPRTPWLEPDINDAIRRLAASGAHGVIVVPIGFVSDHVEVVWDLDTEAAATAAEVGLWFSRVPTPGTDRRFVSGLVDLIEQRLYGNQPVAPVTTLPVRPDRCPAGCCRARTVRPTVAGADSAGDWAGTGFGADVLALSGIGAGTR